MMAFFLVMWLVTAVSKEQRAAIFDYFKNPSMEPGKSVKPAPGQMGPGGASTSPINLRGGLDAPRSSPQKTDAIGATVHDLAGAAHRSEDRGAEGRRSRGAQEAAREEAARCAHAGSEGGHRQEPGAAALQGSAAARHHARGPAHPDPRRAEPADVRSRQLAAEAVHRAKSCAKWQATCAPCRTASASPATPTPRRTPASPATPTGICLPTAPTRRGARWRRRACRPNGSPAWWAWPHRCCSTRRIRAAPSIAASASWC